MVKGGGDFMFPLAYASPVEEHLNTRLNLGIQDLSTMGEVDIKGPGAERLINRLLVNDIRDLEPGQMGYSTMVNQNGGIIDDITVYKFGDEHFMIVTSSAPRKKTARWLADHAQSAAAYTTDITAALALLSVQGPRSRDFLKTIVKEVDLDKLRFFRFNRAFIGETELIISRSGYTGELGFELYVPAEEASVLWEYLIKNGREFGLQPYGTATMQSLRIEKALPLYGPDIDESRTPFHVGLEKWIRFNKRDFIGREALLRVQEQGLTERWTGLVLEGNIAAKNGDKVYSVADIAATRQKMFSGSEAGAYFDKETPGPIVGTITSSAKGHSVDKMLALAYLQTTHAWPGSQLLVNVQGRPVLARVTSTPFFDPQGARLRAKGSK